jgi:hypothetical protein
MPLRQAAQEKPTMRITTFALASLALTACGGGNSSSGSVSSLQGPQQVTLIQSNSGGTGSLRLPAGTAGLAGSDYETATTNLWVRDDSMEALDTVNMILGSLRQTRYWEQTNQGAYRALIESDDRGESDRSAGAPAYEEWTIESTRASNSAPQIVKFWLPMEDSPTGTPIESLIYGRLVVTESPTDSQPLGQFTLYFKSLPESEAPTSTATTFEGYMRTIARTDGQSELEFYMSHGDPDQAQNVGEYSTRDRVHVVGNPTANEGRAYSERKFAMNNGSGTMTDGGEYQLQFDSAYVARRDVTNGNTLAVLDRNEFTTYVYRYGVFDATTEAKVSQQGGFPVQTESGANGWAGFHGIWFPNSVTLTNGQTLLRRSFTNNTTTPYTLVIAPGRLEKRVRSTMTLGDVVNEDFEAFDPSAGGEQRVRYTGSDFVRVATRSNGSWSAVNPPVSIASSYSTGQWVFLWNQARGSVEFSWPSSLSNSTVAYKWTRSTINADSPELASGNLTLYGYFQQLRANITQNQANYLSSETPYFPNASSVSSGNQTYVFDKDSLRLMLGSDPVTLASGVTVTQGPAMWGLNCGPLFSTALTDFSDIPSRTTTYEWSTGTQNWNQLRTLKTQGGAYVSFDAPKRFTYTHSQPSSPYDGRTYFLEWDGSNLGGIPHEEVSGTGRWYPLINIPTGTVVTDGTTSYKIKQLEGEQFMVEVGDPNAVYAARGFDLDTPLTAPTATPYQDPAIGAKPTVTAAPLYVAGVAQSSDS